MAGVFYDSVMTVFFTSDTHFGHGGAMGLFRRPFASVPEMDAAIVARWNETVGPDDTVWHLGDFGVGLKAGRAAELLASLSGTKRLVVGNKDTDEVRALPDWAFVTDYAEMTLGGLDLCICHYPFRSWKNDKRGAWNLHGHSHGKLKPLTRQRDVGTDVWDFRPVTLETLTARNPGKVTPGESGPDS